MLQPSTKPDTVEANAVVVHDGGAPLQLDPAWNRARELLATGKALAVELADEIERLRAMYLRDGHKNLRRGNSPAAQIVQPGESFGAKLQSELGLHHEVAKRILESADYQRRIGSIADAEIGETVTWREKDQPYTVVVTEKNQAAAREAVREWGLPFCPKPARQWAGVMSCEATKGVERAPVNHGKLMDRAVRSLGTNLSHWARLTPVQRASIEQDWEDICAAGLLPDTFVASVMRHHKGRK